MPRPVLPVIDPSLVRVMKQPKGAPFALDDGLRREIARALGRADLSGEAAPGISLTAVIEDLLGRFGAYLVHARDHPEHATPKAVANELQAIAKLLARKSARGHAKARNRLAVLCGERSPLDAVSSAMLLATGAPDGDPEQLRRAIAARLADLARMPRQRGPARALREFVQVAAAVYSEAAAVPGDERQRNQFIALLLGILGPAREAGKPDLVDASLTLSLHPHRIQEMLAGAMCVGAAEGPPIFLSHGRVIQGPADWLRIYLTGRNFVP